ncbi:MAG: DNA-binding transcriptional regulator Fis [Arenicellales bacterium WSBS_2016_MAG_OTU3]
MTTKASNKIIATKRLTHRPENGSVIAASVSKSIKQYLKDLNGETPGNVYNMVLVEMEKPLLEEVMRHVENNQTHAAALLGINRNTLRKKLKTYGLD